MSGVPAAGSRWTTRARTITEADVTMFSALTGDWHPQHSDAEWAKSSLFGERVAHGLLVLSFAFGLGEFDSERVVALRRLHDVVFKRPTRIGDTIRVHALVERVRPMTADTALLDLRWRVVNDRDETLLKVQIEVLCRTRELTETANNDVAFAPDVLPY